ncbi:diphthine--ammonia ligase [Wenyingzhuangia sp. 2_MG-2023]|uniref:Dph6-related ATP pyrophosphatase n=1 Tax=Wenyingzhuangia sp. 2_MG-2023 TaxID=3062639 RepID=UPI0026E23DA4|nr:diphthine--ammonia ligase [Wenyingzhuangia sp. 2_MG-2023]MDO6739210.1 diphthine--ammonia ligase [Wenyingzhuangia sp. 2_MG-2023]MDO6803789.1 diphthine--ammonia ligase [Wenyingzhuangia sp. 1_MG-2023]
MIKAYFNWSSGKDSSLALYKTQNQSDFQVDFLLTNMNKDVNRVSMHGLREELLEAQAKSIGIPLRKIEFSGNVTMKAYDAIMKKSMKTIIDEGYEHCFFGDIFLEDLKAYRDAKLSEVGISGLYPLWKQDTKTLLQEFLDLGFKAITVCVNAQYLDKSFVGRIIDEQFVKDLPENVDVCGENGEFHTFVFDGPIFKTPVLFETGEKVHKTYQPSENDDDNCFQKDTKTDWDTGFWYCDLIPS